MRGSLLAVDGTGSGGNAAVLLIFILSHLQVWLSLDFFCIIVYGVYSKVCHLMLNLGAILPLTQISKFFSRIISLLNPFGFYGLALLVETTGSISPRKDVKRYDDFCHFGCTELS